MINSANKMNIERTSILIAFFLLMLYVSPLFILGENAHIRVHDNLDSNIGWYKVLVNSGELFGDIDAVIPQVQNGNLPRNAFGTEFSGIVWLHALFPSMLAYALSQTITRVFAFIGMYLLLRRHFMKETEHWLIPLGVALVFAMTPFWPSGMLSTLGHPLALWAFLNIRSGDYSLKNWLTLLLLPLYASFVLGFFFFLVAVGLLWVWDVIVKRRFNWVFLGSIALMTAVFLAVEYRLVLSMILPHEPTQRSEFISSRHDMWRSLRLALKNYVVGHNHVRTVHTAIILPITIIGFLLVAVKKWWHHEHRFVFLFFLNIILSVWYAFWFNKMWSPLKAQFDILVTFNWARFHFLRPMVIYVLFALALAMLWRLGRVGRSVATIAIAAQFIVLVFYNEEIRYGTVYHTPSFKEFYAEEQFAEIRDYIKKDQSAYRVASIGLHPVIAQYNGFYTLDTYNNFYPLTYKYEFREIIEKELAKNKALRRYYDEWGSRSYVFVDELGKKYDYRKTSKKVIKHLELNTEAFKKMGGQYLFSAVPIENAEENNLFLRKVFDHPESAWRVHVYEAR